MRILEIEELDELLEEIQIRVLNANRQGTLEELLERLGCSDLVEPVADFVSYRDGKIVVIGESDVKERVLTGVATSLGINKERMEFCLGFEEAERYNYTKLQYAPKYRVILFSAGPHSTPGKGKSSSAIVEMENNTNIYPRVERLYSNGLKTTKSNFRIILEKLIKEQYI